MPQEKIATDNRHHRDDCSDLRLLPCLIVRSDRGQSKKNGESASFNSGSQKNRATLKTARPWGIEGMPTDRTGLLPSWSKMERYLSFPNLCGKITPPRTQGKGSNIIKCHDEEMGANLDHSFIVSPERPKIHPPPIIFPSLFIKHNFMPRQTVIECIYFMSQAIRLDFIHQISLPFTNPLLRR